MQTGSGSCSGRGTCIYRAPAVCRTLAGGYCGTLCPAVGDLQVINAVLLVLMHEFFNRPWGIFMENEPEKQYIFSGNRLVS